MTERRSLRARAQEIYREMSETAQGAAIPTPLIPVQTGIQSDASAAMSEAPGSPPARGRAEEGLTARVRRLYEQTAVPVAEIARLAGVTERTLYKYARKGGWTPRYAWIDAGGVNRQRRRARAGFAPGQFAPVKGAGGRFIARADKDKPFARGLKAADPAGERRAAAQCRAAEALARAAKAKAQAQARARARLRAIMALSETILELGRTVAELPAGATRQDLFRRLETALLRMMEKV